MTFYCPKCFKPINYSLARPSTCPFCKSSCSQQFAASVVKATPTPKVEKKENEPSVRARRIKMDPDGEEFYDQDYYEGKFDSFHASNRKNLNKMGVEVEVDKAVGVKLGDILRSNGEAQPESTEEESI